MAHVTQLPREMYDNKKVHIMRQDSGNRANIYGKNTKYIYSRYFYNPSWVMEFFLNFRVLTIILQESLYSEEGIIRS